MKYKVYFEFYRRKMTTTVEANNEAEAIKRVKERVNIINVVRDDLSCIKDILNIK